MTRSLTHRAEKAGEDTANCAKVSTVRRGPRRVEQKGAAGRGTGGRSRR